MNNNLRRIIPKHRKKKAAPIFARLFLAMLLLSTLQFFIFILAFHASGAFSYIRKYSYDVLIEKTENRKNYVENAFNSKLSVVYEINKEVDNIAERVLRENNASSADLTTDKTLSKKILMDSTDKLITLLRRTAANDAYIIIDTGSLYNQRHNYVKPALYLRDIDSASSGDVNNKDLLMEKGSSEIADNFGLMLDSQWTAHMELNKSENYSFYFKTMETAKSHPDIEENNLGYWSGFSKMNNTDQSSMKYTLPLILNDGTVYGVIGIGFMEKTLLKYMPANDFFSDKACYILATDKGYSDSFIPEMHSGAIYSRIINEDTEINRDHLIEGDVYDFNTNSSISMKTVGNIQEMNIYNSSSPYANEHWALVSVADKNAVLNIYNLILSLFMISFIISAIFSIVCSLFINRHVTTPISKMIKTLDNNKDKDDIIHFPSSNITEIDRLANAVTELQINVKEQASRVSKIISMTEMGIGVFMYDPTNEKVFVAESLIKLLDFKELPAGDTTISFDEFRKHLSALDENNVICGNNIFGKNFSDEDDETFSAELYSPKKGKENAQWFKFTLTRYASKVLGLVQDVTSAVLEMKKVEYERDYDVITGLLNRRAYINKVDEVFRQPEKLKTAAFIMWDLDNLKYVNDTYGHDFGDDYIKTAANTFKAFEEYGGIVSRMSGDEFNVFLSGYDSKDEIRSIIEDVRNRLLSSYCVLPDGTHFKIRASGGISWYPDDSVSYDMLIKYADFAMYTIKHSTKGSVAEFDITTYNKDSILITGVEEMNSIIDRQDIKYAFQSIISAKTGELYGYEALMRPQSALFRSPLEFIRIAKTCVKLHEVERLTWILSLRTFRRFINNGSISPDTKIFINSLSNCILSENDIRLVESENHDILENIVMEILESENANDDFVQRKKKLLKKWNALTALDDFGSGYNSEYALLTLNPNILKIDRAIVSNCDKDISKYNIICNIVQIASLKNVMVLAEGVETYDEMKTVIECGVDLLQGYYFGRPCFEPSFIDEKIKADIKSLNAEKNS